MNGDDLDRLLDALADRVADRVVDKLRGGEREGWIDQHASPLGARRHCALARKLLAEGNAVKVGRRWLVRRERLDLELGAKSIARTESRAERIAAELGLRLVKGSR